MKSLIQKLIVGAIILSSGSLFASVLNCSTDEFIVMQKDQSQYSLRQLAQALEDQVPFVSVNKDASYMLLLTYKMEQKEKTINAQQLSEPQQARYTTILNRIKELGFIVSCNSSLLPSAGDGQLSPGNDSPFVN